VPQGYDQASEDRIMKRMLKLKRQQALEQRAKK